ncbi:MAG: DUF4469 domain-containing protein [Treponema sp.]|nr:DUF4469 domain-containing protein [Spirochaetia bacterium]MDD7459145.1 DUF4469 domain-containing protein [Spirochaetales bacterium]MDY5812404.1 DUF4469 domain-containing protein [Treponema sp.]MEE1181850.1 DUF4469 domain-containing protein [Treponema sp.]
MDEFTLSSGSRTVSLYENTFSADKGFYGRVQKNRMTLENLVANIVENQVGVSEHMIYHAASLIMEEVLRQIRLGNSVDLLNAGTLFLKVNGGVKGKNPKKTDVPGFTLGFTPSQEVLDEVAKVKVDCVRFSDRGAKINSITNTFDNSQSGVLFRGKGVRIKGSLLKTCGENSGIFFAPIVDEEPVTEESRWIRADPNSISVNVPSTLEFYVPSAIECGKMYSIVLKNCMSHGKQLKAPVVSFSAPVMVADSRDSVSS